MCGLRCLVTAWSHEETDFFITPGSFVVVIKPLGGISCGPVHTYITAIINKMGNTINMCLQPRPNDIPEYNKSTGIYFGEGTQICTETQLKKLITDSRSQTPEILYHAAMVRFANRYNDVT